MRLRQYSEYPSGPQHQADSSTRDGTPIFLNLKDINGDLGREGTIKTFPTMLKLISGTLVGGVKYSDLYIDSDEDEDTSSTSSFVNKRDKDHVKKKKERKIPTLPQIAQKVARLEKTQLNEKQYIAYEMIACTFLLGLLNDGRDKNTNWVRTCNKPWRLLLQQRSMMLLKIKSMRWT